MEKKISKSGQSQNENFSTFIKKLVEKFMPLQIYSFGKNSEIGIKSGCFITEQCTENYHYFLLLVTESVTRIEHAVQDFGNSHYLLGKITILAHSQETISTALKSNNRFFITVINEGQLLYSYDGMVERAKDIDFIPTQGAVKAQKHYDHRFPLATGFLKSAEECLQNQHFNLCAFMAHQVVEQCCIALIRIHLAYRSDIHNLYRLLLLCESFSSVPSSLLLSGRQDDERLFEIMVKSYSAARYKDRFHVKEVDAEKIIERVSAFLKVADIMCLEKIESLAAIAKSYKQLSKEGGVNYVG